MRSILKQRPSTALVVAFLALFVALSAGAAADLPGIGVVNSGDIKNNSVRSKDVRNSSLLAEDFKSGQLPAGPRGPQGPTGATGLQGPPGPVKLVHRMGTSSNIAPGTSAGFAVGCPDSAPNVVGGGFEVDPATANVRVVTSAPTDGGDPDGIPDDNWEVSLHNAGASPVTLRTHAICTAATSVEQAPDQL
jgi:hypothetical protein